MDEDQENQNQTQAEQEMSPEEQEGHAQDGKIGWAEAIFIILFSLIIDLVQVGGDFVAPVPVIGWVTVIMTYLMGLFADVVIFIWSITRGGKQSRLMKKLVSSAMRGTIIGIGDIADAVSSGILFGRTIAVVITIVMINLSASRAVKMAKSAVGSSGIVGKVAMKAVEAAA